MNSQLKFDSYKLKNQIWSKIDYIVIVHMIKQNDHGILLKMEVMQKIVMMTSSQLINVICTPSTPCTLTE